MNLTRLVIALLAASTLHTSADNYIAKSIYLFQQKSSVATVSFPVTIDDTKKYVTHIQSAPDSQHIFSIGSDSVRYFNTDEWITLEGEDFDKIISGIPVKLKNDITIQLFKAIGTSAEWILLVYADNLLLNSMIELQRKEDAEQGAAANP